MQKKALTRRGFLGLGAAVGGAAVVGAAATPTWAAEHHRQTQWPTTLNLPDGLHPDALAIGRLPFAFFGSLLTAAIYRANLATGQGEFIFQGLGSGHNAIGLGLDRFGRLFIGGGWGRTITVMDGLTGAVLKTYEGLGTASTCVNLATVTPEAAWFTDGFNGVLFGVPFGPGGTLPEQDGIVTLPLTGEWQQSQNHWQITGAGIAASPDGRALLVINQYVDGGTLFRVDPRTGDARRVPVGGAKFPTTNGIAVSDRTMYAPSQTDLAVVRLSPDGASGDLVRRITDPRFDTPSAVAPYRDRLYLTNSRFPLPPTPTTAYNAVAVPRPE
ncbi:twin-arginine translocation signal domain-containing protein [Streptantibioticus ferralitis]|uniref:Twin-arginine translocation signal domain-containing protein n=1 Tax=Streptantibioticus ferralitis TaxID=236510 RepID=A0ABT5YYM0_9ACTN|nr:twin-arginine translocation signal domain-containing protein [Streptantibioticus ferralitis]MDF2256517.1 twin-arginine translocation signal domain-containing protein [Streptantibioticus ferralitis]